MSPTARSLALLRQRGCRVAVVERYNRFARRHVDAFGVIDILVLDDQPGVLGVQATTVANQAARLKKILDEPDALAWISRGNRLQIFGWAKRGPKGKRKKWDLSVTPITEANWREAQAAR